MRGGFRIAAAIAALVLIPLGGVLLASGLLAVLAVQWASIVFLVLGAFAVGIGLLFARVALTGVAPAGIEEYSLTDASEIADFRAKARARGLLREQVQAEMSSDLARAIELLKRDVSSTIGGSYDNLIREAAADVRELDIDDTAEKLVNDIQQYFHDARIDVTWPACPRHARHPLWYRNGSWWCVQDAAAIAPLGELARSGRTQLGTDR